MKGTRAVNKYINKWLTYLRSYAENHCFHIQDSSEVRIRRSAEYDELGMDKAVKGANTHHNKSLNIYADKSRLQGRYETRIHITVALGEMARYTSQMV